MRHEAVHGSIAYHRVCVTERHGSQGTHSGTGIRPLPFLQTRYFPARPVALRRFLRRRGRRREGGNSSFAPTFRQISPLAASLTVSGNDDVVQKPHIDLVEDIFHAARQAYVARASVCRPAGGGGWYQISAAALCLSACCRITRELTVVRPVEP